MRVPANNPKPARRRKITCCLCRRRNASTGSVLCPACHKRAAFTPDERERSGQARAERLLA